MDAILLTLERIGDLVAQVMSYGFLRQDTLGTQDLVVAATTHDDEMIVDDDGVVDVLDLVTVFETG